ncbi:Por secretion system C-terminal sorting domain-containing protein [Soonwooa buanensis]|uniref:Por secretion system C-terminal sorting domain-containing protein n=1 Tax=Soonwooa buanensis TaxID=619805 RepID=A0A1T5DLC4_9FLAO|nr:M12 family metallo-peptidase [Soonwooa buanensis]SKB72437.1 Por secretion system C-terminal sorting domain-containing protein [Soonwooa buanensis]
MKKIFTSVLACGLFTTAFAQWSPTSMQGEKLRPEVNSQHYYSLDLAQLRSQLKNAQEMGNGAKAVIISLPTMDGKMEKFAVYSLPVVVKSLADKYDLGSYSGVGIDDPTKYVRFSTAPNDFQSMLYQNGKYEFIEPQNAAKTVYGVFPKTNKNSTEKAFECKVNETFASKQDLAKLAKNSDFTNLPSDFSKASDKKYRTYRLAISVTGEYTQYFGGVEQAITAINATMTRVNGVFEKDFAIHLNLQDFPQLIYTNPNTDPYSPASTGAAGAWNKEIQTTLTNTIGNAAYDIGHLFGRSGGGGSAGDIGNVCRDAAASNDSTSKGSAFTSPGTGAPAGDSFDIDYVAHEMGHQFGAWHTFSHGLHAGSIAHMEPGSGSTIMGYAGITNYDVQQHSDPYFHAISVKQVQDYANTQNCDVNTPITNNPPVVAAMPDVTIPKGTAFVLTASATDAENDALTYTWEQYDSSTAAVTTVTGNNTQGPKFRSIMGTSNPTRFFPKQSMVLAGTLSSATEWEAVSNVARPMNFRVTVRDNNPDVKQQQTQFGAQKVTVGNDGPFKVNTTKVYTNAPSPIQWDVVNTTATPYNVANVKIDYTKDNGTTWTTLVASTPNTGTANADLTSLTSGSNIILRVSAIGNVFYAVSNVTVSSMVGCDGTAPAGLTATGITQTSAQATWDPIANATYNFKYKKTADSNWTEANGLTTNSYNLASLTLNTSYDISVAAVCNGTVGAFANYNFTTKGVEYCTATAGNATFESISNVTFADINKSSTSTAGYEDFTSVVGNVTKGTSYDFTAKFTGTSYDTDQVLVWIDYNKDGDFDDAGEQVLVTAKKKSPWTGSITIPATAATGATRMRVRLQDTSFGPNATPCGSSNYGQVEDYTLNIGTLAVNDVQTNNKLQVYPNPATDMINISNIAAKSTYQIVNMAGQVVANGATDGKVQVSKLDKGVYIITVESNGQKSQTKFIKN